ncbi:MAG: serine--tRNA ligase [Clostridia bacterium]
MISLDLIRNETQKVKEMLGYRNDNVDIDRLLELDTEYRSALKDLESLQAKRNELAKIGNASVAEIAKALKAQIVQVSALVDNLLSERNKIWSIVPNMLDERVPQGKSDADNVEIKRVGTPRKFTFEPKWHDELATKLGILDVKNGIKVSASGFLYWIGDGARLQRAMFNFAQDFLLQRGFTLLTTPLLARKETFFGTGYLPFAGDQLYTVGDTGLSLIGTSEQTLVGFHAGETIDLTKGAILYTALTPCFRTEAGSYGKETKGVFRVHQFSKVEQIVFCKPEESRKWHNFCLENEETLFQKLGLPYRVVNVCTGDLGAPASMKYDIEGFFPAYNGYRELTSNSNLLDFQTRRLNVKFKNGDKSEYPHTISATGITERAMLAILENYQNEDGNITIPEVLVPYMGGQTIITKK